MLISIIASMNFLSVKEAIFKTPNYSDWTPTFQSIRTSAPFKVSLPSLLLRSPEGSCYHQHMPEITELFLPLLQMSHTLIFWESDLSPVNAIFTIALEPGRKRHCPPFTRTSQTQALPIKVSLQHSQDQGCISMLERENNPE